MPEDTPAPDTADVAEATEQDVEQPADTATTEVDNDSDSDAAKTFDENYVRKLRDEAAKHRNDRKSVEGERDQLKSTLDQLRKALDPDAAQDEDPATVAERATQERDQKDAELRELRIDRATEKAARTHGADLDALTDSRSFAKAAAELDPESDDFADELDALVKSTIESNPKLRAAPAAPRSGSEFTGGSGSASTFTREQIARMSTAEYDSNRKAINEALAAGRVK